MAQVGARNVLMIVLKLTISKVNSSWHICVQKHSTIQDWLFYRWPDMSNLHWIGVIKIWTLQVKKNLAIWIKTQRKNEGFCAFSCYCTKHVLCNKPFLFLNLLINLYFKAWSSSLLHFYSQMCGINLQVLSFLSEAMWEIRIFKILIEILVFICKRVKQVSASYLPLFSKTTLL